MEKILKESEPVKVNKELMDKVRENKRRTGVSLTRFVEDAIEEKLDKQLISKV